MKPKMIWGNLAVKDLTRTTAFYQTLGFTANNSRESDELTSFKFGAGDFVINFFLKDILETNVKGKFVSAQEANEVIFTLSASSRGEVDDWEKQIHPAGGQIISPAESFGEGYYGFIFADPDGHRFNVFYMEGL